MSEFNSRIDAQRKILRIVNHVPWSVETLHGLTSKTIERWISQNSLNPTAPIVALVRAASAELFFLANRSQEQVTDTYQAHSISVRDLTQKIFVECERLTNFIGRSANTPRNT